MIELDFSYIFTSFFQGIRATHVKESVKKDSDNFELCEAAFIITEI